MKLNVIHSVLNKLINIDYVPGPCHSNFATKFDFKNAPYFTFNQNQDYGCAVVMKRKEDWKK